MANSFRTNFGCPRDSNPDTLLQRQVSYPLNKGAVGAGYAKCNGLIINA